MADLEYDLIDDLIIFPGLDEHEFVLVRLHVVSDALKEVVHQRSE